MRIGFAVWAPSEQAFWQSWVDAGIVTYNKDDDRYEYTLEYPGIQTTAEMGWNGIAEKTPAVFDANGDIVTPAVNVVGWHTNVRVEGALVDEMTYGLAQHDGNGDPIDLFDRTWAKEIFQLTYKSADPVTGFPEGYQNSDGVTYTAATSLKSPSNVIQ